VDLNLNTALSGADLARTKVEVDAFNKALSQGKAASTRDLDKDDFLKILITQLQHQDPTSPMQDKEFIAQMAQFSALEQMTNMSTGFQKLSGLLASSEATGYLGKNVEIRDGDNLVTGIVEKVVRGDVPLVGVGGRFYDFSQVESVLE
jgi:flagellar basal-body rod modification protein FlgD